TSAPYVLKSSEMDSESIRSQLSYRMRYTVGEGASDGGEAMLYSFYNMLDPGNVQEAKEEGFFRDEAALVVVFVTDENDICARYPDGVTPVYDPQRKEFSAFNNYCSDVTPESVLSKANIFVSGKPLVMAGIVYHEESVVPSGGENEMAYGILELIEQASGAKIDLAGGNYHIGLSQIGSLAVKKLSLKTDFVLASSNVDTESFEVKVDNVDVAFSYNEVNATVSLTDYAGIENSEIFIGYCEPPEEPDLVAPVISNLAVNQITGGSALIEWNTDIAASSQVKITHVASGANVLTNLMPSLKTDHAVSIQGLNPDTLYKVQAISVTQGMEAYSGELSFRTGRSIN
ncbi:MAG: fibronectin type III domain-containing protein, partial [Bdellovibrionota bacterium]|nr:fibronectin type III domain-containing protein [Bdellovibrionota bacterium]